MFVVIINSAATYLDGPRS